MKTQYGIRSLLLFVGFVGVVLGAWLAEFQIVRDPNMPSDFPSLAFNALFLTAYTSPFWVPLGPASYAIGRRTLTFRTVLVLAIAECLAIATSRAMNF